MKISCNREKLLAAYQTAASVAPSRSTKPILQNVKIEAADGKAMLTATDLEVGIRIELPDIDVEVPGSAVLPIDRFSSILRESSDETLRLEADGQGTTVTAERSHFKLPGENPEEFPQVAVFSDERYHEVPARLLKELIRRTIFATDSESSRYALGGVLLDFSEDRVIAVGTDGRRLAEMEGPAQRIGDASAIESSTIVPTRAMQLIERAFSDADAEIQIATRDNDVLVRSPRITVYSRLVDGRFPNWKDVFPQRTGATQVEFTVGSLHSAVRQAMIVTSEESRGVDFTFADGTLVLTAESADKGQSRVEMPISYDAEPISIMLDPRYMNDFLKVLDADRTFTMEIKDSESAAVSTTDDGYSYVIMPLARDR